MGKYIIKNTDDKEVSTDILKLHYGILWETMLDRLTPRPDGYLLRIKRKGKRYRIFREPFEEK